MLLDIAGRETHGVAVAHTLVDVEPLFCLQADAGKWDSGRARRLHRAFAAVKHRNTDDSGEFVSGEEVVDLNVGW